MVHRGLVRSFVNSGRWVGRAGDLRWRSLCSCDWKGCEWATLPDAYREAFEHVAVERAYDAAVRP